MKRLFLLLLTLTLITAVALAAVYLVRQPGGIEFDLFGLQGALPLWLAVLVIVLLGGGAAALWWIVTGLFVLPGKLGVSRARRLTSRANKALADGLLAAEAGDVKTAAALAKKASKHAEDERLKLLLDARMAEAGQDWIGAERAWGLLTRLPGGELAGLRGAASAAIERGDPGSAEANARQALALKSAADWPFTSLFDLQVSRQEWATALETLALGEKRGLISGESLHRRRAVLLTAHAVSLPPEEKIAAQKALAEALKSAPSFPPAAWLGARHLIAEDKFKPAFGVIELAWKAGPHPALARLARQISSSAKPGGHLRLTRLVESKPAHRESRILKAEIAMQDGKWADAVRILAVLVEEEPTARLCLLMESALKGYGDREEAARWARMAVTAAREADWSDLDPKGMAFNYEPADWSRLVYRFGDAGQLVHPRYEAFGRELDASRPAPALPAPGSTPPPEPMRPGALSAPLDYAPSED